MGALDEHRAFFRGRKITDGKAHAVLGDAVKGMRFALLPALLIALLLAVSGCGVSFNDSRSKDDASLVRDANLELDATLHSDASHDADEEAGSSGDGDGGGESDANSEADAAVEVDAGPCGGNCSGDEVCVNGECCLPQQSNESYCDNGVDDDCDGQADCADTDCDGQACDDGNENTTDDACDLNTGMCVGVPCTWVQICDQCPTGSCEDVLIHEDTGCSCASSVAAPNCDMSVSPYEVPCGGGNYCTFERREITQQCNCHNECQP